MSTRATPPTPSSTPSSNPLPIQFTNFSKEDLQSDAGVSRLNLLFAQYTPIINALLGSAGPTLLPSGVDVQGAKVTGLAAPKNESDAVSFGHAQGSYGPAAQQPQLDIGGDYTLKGLAATYQTGQTNTASITAILTILATGVTGTVTLAKITSGGTNGSLTFVKGLITNFVAPS